MKTITQLSEYCKEVNIPQPKYPFFDIRRFEDKMKTEKTKQEPFRHEFYAIGLRLAGQNTEVNGKHLNANIFFNSPYQIISWEILPDWKGWYIIFDKNFLAMNPAWKNFTIEFPYFKLDKSISFNLEEKDQTLADIFFQKIAEEYSSDNKDKFFFIQSYTQLLLLLTKRYFERLESSAGANQDNKTLDIVLVSRFQTLVEIYLNNENSGDKIRSPSFYAEQLFVHPNHLNSVVKRVSGKTASQIIHNQLISVAKSFLNQTTLSVKEISYRLNFKEPTHFNAFFKKMAGISPQQFRTDYLL